jgi:hypothetical protein
MLVDLTPNFDEGQRRIQISKENNFEYVPQYDKQWKHGTGIYQCNLGFNFSHEEFEEFKDQCNIPYDDEFNAFAPTYHKSQYGVADNLDQIKEYFKEEIDDPDSKYFISLTPVFQDLENKGKGGGWRWHKWGEYIGKLNPQCEYLDDEEFGDDFRYVVCFHIYPVK